MTAFGKTSNDVTTLFKSCVKTIQTRNKAIGITNPQTKILASTPASSFFRKARDIQSNINSHSHLLIEHKKKYINDNVNSLSDVEKSYMDKVVSKNLNIIEDNIKTLEADLSEKKNNKDCKESHLSAISILRANYVEIYSTFRDMKDLRQKKQKQKEQLFRLQRPLNSKRKSPTCSNTRNSSIENKTSSNPDRKSEKLHNWGDSFEECEEVFSDLEIRNGFSSTKSLTESGYRISKPTTDYLEVEKEENFQQLDEEERKLLEEENKNLYNELMLNHEEVKNITRQVAELGRMQDILTENVETQAQQIDDIHDSILLATDNVQRGNEQVREAMRKDASFRVWIMFFLIVMSCTILFLDWYNP